MPSIVFSTDESKCTLSTFLVPCVYMIQSKLWRWFFSILYLVVVKWVIVKRLFSLIRLLVEMKLCHPSILCQSSHHDFIAAFLPTDARQCLRILLKMSLTTATIKLTPNEIILEEEELGPAHLFIPLPGLSQCCVCMGYSVHKPRTCNQLNANRVITRVQQGENESCGLLFILKIPRLSKTLQCYWKERPKGVGLHQPRETPWLLGASSRGNTRVLARGAWAWEVLWFYLELPSQWHPWWFPQLFQTSVSPLA